MQKRKTFTPEFKREAVRLLEQGDRSPAELARELGVRRNQLYKWKEQLSNRGEAAFPGHGRPPNDPQNEVRGQSKNSAVAGSFYSDPENPSALPLQPRRMSKRQDQTPLPCRPGKKFRLLSPDSL